MTKTLNALATITIALTTTLAAAQTPPDDLADFKRRAASADAQASRERMIDAVGRKACEAYNAPATASQFFECLGGARGTAEDMARRTMTPEQSPMLPPLKERSAFSELALYTHCKRHLDDPFMSGTYAACKLGVDGAIAIVAKAIAPKPQTKNK